MSFCDTCGHQYSDVCGGCESLEGVPVKYTEKGSKTIVPICGTCVSKEHCAVAECSHYEKQLKLTNADRIRAMTDEELAEFLEKVADGCDSCPMLKECTYSDEEISEKQIRLKWLKQEVSNDS